MGAYIHGVSIIIGASLSEPHTDGGNLRIFCMYVYLRTSPARRLIDNVLCAIQISARQRPHGGKLLCVTCTGVASTRRLGCTIYEATLEEDGAIDQSVSVSESPEGMIGGFKERALRALTIRVDRQSE